MMAFNQKKKKNGAPPTYLDEPAQYPSQPYTLEMHKFENLKQNCQISENSVNNPGVQSNGNPAFVKVLTGPTWAGIHIESA